MHAAPSRAPIEAITEEQFQRIFNVNVLGLLLTGAAALRFQKGLDSK
jgi:NAD(P)-dependent dehydrogenase (short-subunit alcohol dehydrogenase family)